MYCVNCGKEIEDTMEYCDACRRLLQKDVPEILVEKEQKEPQAAAETDETAKNGDSPDRIKIIAGIKIIVLIGICCFFFPFMTVSCGKDMEIAELSGTDLIFGTDEMKEYMDEIDKEVFEGTGQSNSEDQSVFNWFVCLAAIFAVAELFTIKYMGKGAGAAVFFLVLFRLTARWYYDLNEDTGKLVELDFGFALYLAIAIFSLVSFLDKDRHS